MLDELKGYWRAYGGVLALATSPYLWASLALTVVCSLWWTKDGRWADLSLALLPSLLGFTIGAMAVVLAFPTTRIFRILAEDGRADSYYVQLAAKLAHFILIQVAGILVAIVHKAYEHSFLAYAGFFLLIYAISTAVALALSLFGMAQLYNEASVLDGDEG